MWGTSVAFTEPEFGWVRGSCRTGHQEMLDPNHHHLTHARSPRQYHSIYSSRYTHRLAHKPVLWCRGHCKQQCREGPVGRDIRGFFAGCAHM